MMETKIQILQIHLGPEANKGIIYYLEADEYKAKEVSFFDSPEMIDFGNIFDYLRKE